MIRRYLASDGKKLWELWNGSGVLLGYAPVTEAQFSRLLIGHPDFSPQLTFLLEEKGELLGFVSGCSGAGLPQGAVRGYVTCLILKQDANTQTNALALLSVLEQELKSRGLRECAVSFWNPVRLPWVLPGTKGHQHNNMPGVPTDLPLYHWMGGFGYREVSRECAMHLDLEDYAFPTWIREKESRMAEAGYRVEPYDPACHRGLRDMVDTLGNPLWSAEIPAAGKAGMLLLAGLKDRTCVGFAGPIYPEETGRGYFSGIGVTPDQEGHGLGTLLFYRLLEAEKAAGARYMSLFTGESNPAKQIYRKAGFQIRRKFGVLIKEL